MSLLNLDHAIRTTWHNPDGTYGCAYECEGHIICETYGPTAVAAQAKADEHLNGIRAVRQMPEVRARYGLGEAHDEWSPSVGGKR